jgi:hypothetical protein
MSRLRWRLLPAQSSVLASALWLCHGVGSFRLRAHLRNRPRKRLLIERTHNKVKEFHI